MLINQLKNGYICKLKTIKKNFKDEKILFCFNKSFGV